MDSHLANSEQERAFLAIILVAVIMYGVEENLQLCLDHVWASLNKWGPNLPNLTCIIGKEIGFKISSSVVWLSLNDLLGMRVIIHATNTKLKTPPKYPVINEIVPKLIRNYHRSPSAKRLWNKLEEYFGAGWNVVKTYQENSALISLHPSQVIWFEYKGKTWRYIIWAYCH